MTEQPPTTYWDEDWPEDVWEEAILHHEIITGLIYQEMFREAMTGTGVVPEWISRAAQQIVRYYMCQRCGYGLVDLGVTRRKCNDCAPLIHASEGSGRG